MEKIRSLNNYQKGILIVMMIMALIFAVIYPKTISNVGYRYNDTILVPTQENRNTVYSGKIHGKQTQFIVSDDKTVVLQYDDKAYGPYTMKEDSTAIPKDEEDERIIGVEIRNGENILFRGGILDLGDNYWFFSEDGSLNNFGLSNNDEMEPSASTIYELLTDPPLTHKGEALVWFGAVFICILNALSILFADELFRLNLLFQIRNVENVEPSDWEIAGRYIGWTIITIMALVLFITGLQ